MAIFGHSEFFSDNLSLHITLIECNGLESKNKIVRKNIFIKKKFYKKTQIWTKNYFSEIFQSS